AKAAINLAKAVGARKVAALAATGAEGLGVAPKGAEASEKKILNVEWDETFFGSIDGLDATPEEKTALLTLKQQIQRGSGPAAAATTSQATSAPEDATANEQQRIAEEAKKLSEAKFAAAALASKAKGKGTAAS
ncbi:unnamed protein product, partial [Prorocentrum cordatum]